MRLPIEMLLPLEIVGRGLKFIPACTYLVRTAAFSGVGVHTATFAVARWHRRAHPTHVLPAVTVLSWGVGAVVVHVTMPVECYAAMEASHSAALLLTDVTRASQQLFSPPWFSLLSLQSCLLNKTER